jgi:hypothetical protein
MNEIQSPSQNSLPRRQWIAKAARSVIMTAMAAFGIGQVYKARKLENDPNCIRLYTCNDCVEYGGCELDKAVAFRQSQDKPASNNS